MIMNYFPVILDLCMLMFLLNNLHSDDAEYSCVGENTGAPGNIFTVTSDPVKVNVDRK